MGTTVFQRRRPAAHVVDHALELTRFGSFWLDDAHGDRYPALESDLECDLLVVGGGYSGLWTALLAAQRDPGASVALLEARTIGWAASGRNGGFCEASLTHGEANGRARWPGEYGRLEALGRKNLDEIEATIARLGLEVDFERNGAIDVATEPHQVQWLRDAADGTSALFLDEDAMQEEVHSPTYLAGLWRTRDSSLVHPAKLAFELARACAEAGVRIFEHTLAQAVLTDPLGPVTVRTPDASVRARQVALATNAFPSLLRRNRLATVPVYDYALMTEPLTAEQLRSIGWRGRQGIGDTANQFHYYRLSADNRMLWGGYDAVYHYGRHVRSRYENRPETHRMLAEHFFTTFPQLEGVRFSHRWAGAIDTCSRFCAFHGVARGGRVAYSAGYTGLGVGATRFGAQVMLDLLAGERTERTESEMVRSRPLPFPPEPVASLGIQAARWSLDRADRNSGKRNLLLRALDAIGLGFDS